MKARYTRHKVQTTMAEVFEKYAIGAMEEALKAVIAEKKAEGGAE